MTDGGRGVDLDDGDDGDERRYPASRLRPRAGGRPTGSGVGPVGDAPLAGDPLLDDPLAADPVPGPLGAGRPGGSLFAPKSFAGGRVQVFGCAPGFLIISIVLSLLLTLLLNALL